eukprot:c16326_g1_i1.p1 GENE.c16326_g1_i1~~c16326_g1_i1.p1  ORF type:complete len:345 (+),score=147.69 c16326_g1_i1:29-1036(+)
MKGNQIPEIMMKNTKVPQFDDFFTKASKPLERLVSWNNELDDMVFKFRKLGMDIRAASTVDAPPPLGVLKIEIKVNDIILTIFKDNKPIPEASLDKVVKERLTLVRKKAKLLQERLVTLRKRQGLEEATFKLKDDEPTQIEVVANKSILEALKDEDEVADLSRSLMKFNNRSALLVLQLQGNLTLAECVSALINSLKDELKKKAKAIKLAIEDGMPKIEGIPDDLENFVPELVVRGWKLFNQLVDYLKNLKENVAALEPELEQFISEAKELPATVKSAAESASLSAMETIKAGKITAENVKVLGTAPQITKSLSSTVQDTLLEIAGSVEKLVNSN